MYSLWSCKSAPYLIVTLNPNPEPWSFESKVSSLWHNVKDYYCAEFQSIPIRDFRFIMLTYTHIHTHTYHDKVILISALMMWCGSTDDDDDEVNFHVMMFASRSRGRGWQRNRPTRRSRNRLGLKKHLLDRHRYRSHRSGTSEWILPQDHHLGGVARTPSHCRWPTWWVGIFSVVILLSYLLFAV